MVVSKGGAPWTLIYSGVPFDLNTIWVANDTFFVLSQRGALLTSTNGTLWSQTNLGFAGIKQVTLKTIKLYPGFVTERIDTWR